MSAYRRYCVHTHNGILISHTQSELMTSTAAGMRLELVTLSEGRKRQIPHDYNLYVESIIWHN